MDYILHLIILICIYVIITISSSLIIGVSNLFSLAQAALFGIGAYTAGILITRFDLSLFPIFISVLLLSGTASLLVSVSTLRLKNDYFILGTLAFQTLFLTFFLNNEGLTNGPLGIKGISIPSIFFNVSFTGNYYLLILSIFFLFVTAILFIYLINSPFGRILRAIKDDELLVLSSGRNVTFYKISAFYISASFTGIAGMLYAIHLSYIDPFMFNLDESMLIVSCVLIGGSGNLKGPFAGVLFILLIPEILKFTGLPQNVAANLRQIIYGLLIIIIVRYRPQGILGKYILK